VPKFFHDPAVEEGTLLLLSLESTELNILKGMGAAAFFDCLEELLSELVAIALVVAAPALLLLLLLRTLDDDV
jgi:hypothetical protein